MQGHPIGRARAALRALHRAQRSGEFETDVESNIAESGNLEVAFSFHRHSRARFQCSDVLGLATLKVPSSAQQDETAML